MKWYKTSPRINRELTDTFEGWLEICALWWSGTGWWRGVVGRIRIKVAPKEDRTADGVVFASKREMGEYLKLKALERGGIISGLRLQPRFPIIVNGVKVCDYVADFACVDREGRPCIYDAKGMITEKYKLKSKLFHACYPDLRIVEL